MFRILIIIVVSFSVLHCTQADAQLFGRRHQSKRGAKLQRYDSHRQPAKAEQNYRSYRTSSGLNINIGIGTFPGYGYYPGFGSFGYLDPYRFDGYGYDPYRYGSFEAPDLLKDPYFRERYRYDSQFPGRYRVPKVPRSSTAIGLEELYGFNRTPDPRDGASILVEPQSETGDLGKATEQLARGLEVSEYGEAWLEYLAPRRLASLIAERKTQGKTAELQELLTHYDGVVANPELRYITATPGFAETRERLKRYFGQSTSELNGRTIRVVPSTVEPPLSETRDQPETLPVPQSSAEPEPRLNSANGV
jgi:hypothetical protein